MGAQRHSPQRVVIDLRPIALMLQRSVSADESRAMIRLLVKARTRSAALRVVVGECQIACPLGVHLRAVVCVARQIISDREVGNLSRTVAKRGRCSTFVHCRTSLCTQGALVRALLGDTPEAEALARHVNKREAWKLGT